jgi:hypothetical protein
MPLILNSQTVVNETIDRIELSSVTFDIEARVVHIAYDEGFDNAGTFEPLRKDVILTIPTDMVPTFLNVWQSATGPNKFAEMRKACLQAIDSLANRPGSVTGEN